MTIEGVIQLGMQAILTIFFVVGPPLAVAMAVGLFIAIFQATTQIQETSLTFVPKMTAIALTLIYTGRWSINHMISFVQEVMRHVEGVHL